MESLIGKLTGCQTGSHVDQTVKHKSFCRDDEYEPPASEACPPIAICGMALRLPGGVNSPDEFWKFLIEKRDGLCEVPESRYKLDSFYSESRPHSVRTRKGYFLQEDPACFDADFFSISPAEAERMDPQQRQLLEVVWECLENAGETNWRGKEIGCYVGVYGEDWLDLAHKDPQSVDRYYVLGTGQFALSNRVSYEYDFQGPSMTLQTGCSSSMVGLHEACQALYSRDCSSAIVAGTNLILAPTMTTTMSENMVLSPSGMCRTFDEKADGYGRGEAVNAIYIKRLDDAIRNNDPVRAVIRATSSNCDGKTVSMTTPGSLSQERLIRKAYEKARIENISLTGFFECHGTGTTVGDTAEVSVVANLFQEQGIIIGAVKPNVGHSEGASGITSVIKTVLALEKREIPPNIFFDTPNPKIPFKEAQLQVPTEAMPWPKDRMERASVNCFGIGGANGHVVLDSRASFCKTNASPRNLKSLPDHSSRILFVSAKSTEALQQRIQDITRYVNEQPDLLTDIAYTLGARREHLSHRSFAVVSPNKPLDTSAFQIGQAKTTKVSFVFTGQGAQWAGMGKDLVEKFGCFREDIQMLNSALQELETPPTWSLLHELTRADGQVNRAKFSQPLCTALQIGLVNLLRRMGVQPSSVVGHSSGEIAAAYAAGAITAKSAMAVSYYRGQVTESQDGKGAMVAVGIGRKAISTHLEDGVIVACENSPESVTLSGDIDAMENVIERVKGLFPDALCRRLRIQTAYHSHHMLEPGQIYESQITSYIEPSKAMLPLFSSVTSTPINDPKELDAAYWRRNLQSPVLFYDAMKSLLSEPENGQCFLEVGPHSALAGPLRQIFKSMSPSGECIYIPTLTRHADDTRSQLLHTVGCAHVAGMHVDFAAINGHGSTLGNLPPYSWQHKTRFWRESRLATQWRERQSPRHEILGARVAESSDIEPSWRNILHLEDVPWLWDHVLQGNVVFPAAGYIAMAGEAIRQLNPAMEDYSVRNLVLKSPLLLKDDQVIEMVFTLKPVKITDLVDSEWYAFTIMTHDGIDWTKHCEGRVRSQFDYPPSVTCIKRNIRAVDSDAWYQALDKHGLSYGPCFRGLSDIAADPVKFEADATVTDRISSCPSRYTLHPTIIDQCLQLMSVALTNGLSRRIDRLAIPAAIGRLYIGGNAPSMRLGVEIVKHAIGSSLGSSVLMANDKPLLVLDQAAFFSVPDQAVSDNIPLSAEIRWNLDIGLTPTELWIPRPHVSGKEWSISNDFAKAALLHILETDDRLKGCHITEPHLVKYRHWVAEKAFEIRSGQNRIFSEWEDWVTMDSEGRHQAIQEIASRWEEDPEFTGPISCVRAIWENCVEIVTGAKNPLDVLMKGDKLDGYYEAGCLLAFWHRPIQLLGHANPTMRILEIGGGTGSATSRFLRNLETAEGICLYSKYVFTDISPGFTVAAQEKFTTEKKMEFKVLDICRDPEGQGFEPHSFDLVVASNVLHATPSLKETLKNVYKLLSPCGKLFLHELHPETLGTDYVMGVLPGWWHGDKDERPGRPYVSPERWDCELRAAGFTGSEACAYDIAPPFQQNFTMLSGISKQTTDQKVLLIGDKRDSAWVDDVVSEFGKNGYQVDWGTLENTPPLNADIIFLLDGDEPFLYNIQEKKFLLLQEMMLKIERRIIWVTTATQLTCTDPRYSLIYGLARTLRVEMGIDISVFETDVFDKAAANSLCKVYGKIHHSREVQELDPDFEFSYHDKAVHTGRCHWANPSKNQMCLLEPSDNEVVKLDVGTLGLLDTLCWSQIPEESLGDDKVEIEIRYVGLNFRDILAALGLVGDKQEIGLEGSGIIRRVGSNVKGFSPGDRVVTLNPGLLQTRIVVTSDRCMKSSDALSLEEAVTMPTAYATAMYSLIELGSLKKGQTVLIHSACGGVGIASIQVCQSLGAEVFATVGNDEKVLYLMEHFAIPRNRIFNSRSKGFLPEIMRETNGRGVDIVLNSLAGELLHASWECVASRGKMIEIGKRDILTNGALNMLPFGRNRAFIGLDLLGLFQDDPHMLRDLFLRSVEWHGQGKIKPIQPIKKFPASQIQDAFRYMQQGVHMGKILIEMPQGSAHTALETNKSKPNFSAEKTYLLVGGLGGLGRTISTWMVENGARHIVYLSRSAGQSPGDQKFLEELKVQGCHPICVVGSVSESADVQRAVNTCIKPLAGVLQMSMNLNDRTFGKMTYDEWTSALSPKVKGTMNLHHAVRNEKLDFFVVASSICGTCGNTGQANYAAANTFLDSFAQYRRGLGLPCSSLALGAVVNIGLLSRNSTTMQHLQSTAIRFLDEGEVIRGLKIAIDRSRVDMPSSTILGLGNTKPLSDPGVRALWNRDMRYALYYNMESEVETHTEASSDRLRALLAKIEKDPSLLDEPDTEATICRELGKLITQHMPIAEDLDDEQTSRLTIDSLMAIEMRGWARRNLGLELSLAAITKAGTIGKLGTVVIEQLRAKYCVG